MAEGRGRAEWSRTSLLAAVVMNASGRLRRPVRPADFDPYRRRLDGLKFNRENLPFIKTLFQGYEKRKK